MVNGQILGSPEYAEEFENLCKNALGIFHLAGHAGVVDHEIYPWMPGSDYAATAHVLQSALKYSVPVVVISSAHALECINVYGQLKRSIEQLCRLYLNRGLQISVARLFNIFGEEQDEAITYRSVVTTSLIRQFLGQDQVSIKTADTLRDYVYVADVVAALQYLMFDGSQGVYEIGSGVLTNTQHLAGIISGLCDFTGLVDFNSTHEPDPYKRAALADWMPQHTSLPEGLDKTVASWRERHG